MFWYMKNEKLVSVLQYLYNFFVLSGVGGASALTVALQLQNYLGKHCL